MFHFNRNAQLLLLFSAIATSLIASEYIEHYNVDITVNEDRSINVIETIIVNSEGINMRHGITRTFPTSYQGSEFLNWAGLRQKTGFQPIKVTHNGKPTQYTKVPYQNGYLLKTGSKDIILSPGKHTYIISYRSPYQIGSYSSKDRGSWDELYYNVLGTDSIFPVRSASCTINLPKEVPSNLIEAKILYGSSGERHKEIPALIKNNIVSFSTPSQLILRPHEGITAIISFPQGSIHQLSFIEKIIRFLIDNSILLSLIILFFISLYVLIKTKSRYTDKKFLNVIIPLFERPKDIDADQARLLFKKDIDIKAYTARIIQLAIDGYITIDWENDLHVLKKTGKQPIRQNELFLLQQIFGQGAEYVMKPYSYTMRATINGIREYLTSFKNKWIYAPGIARAILLAITLATIFALSFLTDDTSISLAEMIFYLLNALCIFFTSSHQTYTDDGKKPAEEVLGLGMYLNFTDKERLKYTVDTKLTPNTYEYLLPYAIALDAEEAWHQQFKSIFESLERQGTPYQPAWYRGRAFNYYTFSDTFSSNLNSSIASAQRAPGSSSGRSGGSVGGGGGGGGVGGW